MPVTRGTDSEGAFYRWGSRGAKYRYTPGDDESRAEARRKAEAQGRAARAAGYGGASKPTKAMQRNALRAQRVRAQKPPSQRGMTETGLARMRQIVNRQNISLDTARKMVAWFARHLVDKQGATWDDRGKGWQAWNGWGGDEGARWALARLRSEAPEDYERLRKSDGVAALIRHLNNR